MTMTGAIYAVLLAPVAADVSTQLDWVNTVVHVLAPIVVLGDWLIDLIEPAPTWRSALWWLAFPIAWLAYTVIRGLIVDWYPYPFIDPRDGVEHAAGSWPVVIVTSLVLSVVVAVVAQALPWAAARRATHGDTDRAPGGTVGRWPPTSTRSPRSPLGRRGCASCRPCGPTGRPSRRW